MSTDFYNEHKHQTLKSIFDLSNKDNLYIAEIMLLKAAFSSALSLIGFKVDEFYVGDKCKDHNYLHNKKIPLMNKLTETSIDETIRLLKYIRHSSAHLYHDPFNFYVNKRLIDEVNAYGLNIYHEFAIFDDKPEIKKYQITLFGSIVLIAIFLSKLERVFFYRQLFDNSEQDINTIRKQIEVVPSTENLKFNQEKAESRKLRFIYKFLTLPMMLIVFNIERYYYELNPSVIEKTNNSLPRMLMNFGVSNQYIEHIALLRKSMMHGNYFGKKHINIKNEILVKDILFSIKSIYTWDVISNDEHLRKQIADLLEILIYGKYKKLDTQMSYFRKQSLYLKDLKYTNQIYGTIIDWHMDISERDENAIYDLITIYSNRKIRTREIYVYNNALSEATKRRKRTDYQSNKTSLILIGQVNEYEKLKDFSLKICNDFKLIFDSKLTRIYSNE